MRSVQMTALSGRLMAVIIRYIEDILTIVHDGDDDDGDDGDDDDGGDDGDDGGRFMVSGT